MTTVVVKQPDAVSLRDAPDPMTIAAVVFVLLVSAEKALEAAALLNVSAIQFVALNGSTLMRVDDPAGTDRLDPAAVVFD